MNSTHIQLARRYFTCLAGTFPVMCASDEFHFLPRAIDAADYYHRLDDLSADVINECIHEMKRYRQEFVRMAAEEQDLEKRIDLELLKANVTGVLIELEWNQGWRHNPLLYLKIAFIGMDHALNKPASGWPEIMDRTMERLSGIPGLLNQAMENIDSIPQSYYHAAVAMVHDCRQYLLGTAEKFNGQCSKDVISDFQPVMASLDVFEKYLHSMNFIPDNLFSSTSLNASLNDHFLSDRNLDEVFQIAVDEWRENLEDLKKLQSAIDPTRSWQVLYHDYFPDSGETDTLTLYRLETERLRTFFSRHAFREKDLGFPLEISTTPEYLKSVRSAASFGAAFSTDEREKSFFYITTHFDEEQGDQKANECLQKRLHREYKFLTAHETIPGHHLLDSVRRRLINPVRRQIESPLFYEGWAYYAESLLTEHGYVKDPLEYLVDHKRRLWRAARCQIDVGLHADLLTLKDAVGLLTTVGFSRKEAKRQIDRFQLNPGYQLCYSLGRYEIMRLKKIYAGRMGNAQFHAFLLKGGELPFHWIEKRLQKQVQGHTGNQSRIEEKDKE